MRGLALSVAYVLIKYFIINRAATFKFVFYENELYINRGSIRLFDRAYQTIYGLFQLQHATRSGTMKQITGKMIPNICVRVNGVATDGDGAGELGFWRKKGTNNSMLFPEHDYWGWADTWSTPYPLYWRVMKENLIPWEDRVNAIYWTGSFSRQIRRYYHNCSKNHPLYVKSNTFDWESVRDPSYQQVHNNTMTKDFLLNASNNYKPLHMDARQRMKYKYGIYFNGITWSSSFKRIASAGNVLIVPVYNQYESLFTYLLETKCPNCFLTYNESATEKEFCDHILKLIHHNSKPSHDKKSKLMAEALFKFIDKYFSLEYVLGNMFETFQIISSQQSTDYIKSCVKNGKMEKYDCKKLREDHNPGDRLKWQYDEWYTKNCIMKLDSTYLNYTSLR